MFSCLACGVSQKQRQLSGITFHRFPSDLQRRKLWLNFINREDKDVPQYATLCSQHFDESVFDKSAFMVKILPNAVPTRKTKASESTVVISDTEIIESEKTLLSVDMPTAPLASKPIAAREDVPCTTVQVEVRGNSPSTEQLEQQVRKLAAANLRKDQQIRYFQKKSWAQKNRILELQSGIKELKSVIKELKKKHLIKEDTILSQCSELSDELVSVSDEQEEEELYINDHNYAKLDNDEDV